MIEWLSFCFFCYVCDIETSIIKFIYNQQKAMIIISSSIQAMAFLVAGSSLLFAWDSYLVRWSFDRNQKARNLLVLSRLAVVKGCQLSFSETHDKIYLLLLK